MTLFFSGAYAMILITLLWGVQLLLGAKNMLNYSSLSPLESGFEAVKPGAMPSAPFFFLAVLFVLFDLELVLMFPGVVSLSKSLLTENTWTLILVVIMVTLLLEWAWSGLKWQT